MTCKDWFCSKMLFNKRTIDRSINEAESVDNSVVSLDHIQRIHANVNEMIRFGEAKNGALLTVNFLILYSMFSGIIPLQTLLLTIINYASIGCLISSIIVLFITFIPKLNIQKEFNPVFFGTITMICKDEFVSRMSKIQFDELSKYYCEQIHINSQIAKYKFACFKIAIVLSMISFSGSIIVLFFK